MKSGVFKIAYVVPCYNEESRFNISYWNLVASNFPEILWLFVDDGSSDKTYEKLLGLSYLFNCKVLRKPLNAGKSEALRSGFNYLFAQFPELVALGFLDCDGAVELQDISHISMGYEDHDNASLENWDCIIASRIKLAGRRIKRNKSRHYIGRIFVTIATFGWEEAPYDTQCGLKLFRNSPALQNSMKTQYRTRWFFDVELFLRISTNREQEVIIKEIPLNAWQDINGSKITILEKFRVVKELFYITRLVAKNKYLRRN